jgi:hypothetical protein
MARANNHVCEHEGTRDCARGDCPIKMRPSRELLFVRKDEMSADVCRQVATGVLRRHRALRRSKDSVEGNIDVCIILADVDEKHSFTE